MGGGSATAPAIPAAGNSGATQARHAEMLALRETRAKDAFSLLLSWIDPEDDIHHNLTANHFQDGLAAMQQLDQEMDIAILRSDKAR